MDHNPDLEDRYRHGACYEMAIALHRRLGLPIEVLTAFRGKHDTLPHPAHAWVADPDGCLDAGGRHARDDILDEFLKGRSDRTIQSARITVFPTEADFLAELKRLYNDDTSWTNWYLKHLEREVPKALAVVDSYVVPRYLSEKADPETDMVPDLA
ncbi:hypothetical protein LAZ40_05710 [Cereibacter sphaeroides]|uniref:hypothetical protein n=1 Tax=Cereibacter sphaeroides TaxID=1063 RepID=UPI001F1C6503|nr:hypothetical protein [Cereibacter sphaeroides]MCE6958546.1 hypothetical protein [Cereibacter sphaeroides]MCE6972791.1 hypothetical protein [Cereibacter sphaeroides]